MGPASLWDTPGTLVPVAALGDVGSTPGRNNNLLCTEESQEALHPCFFLPEGSPGDELI